MGSAEPAPPAGANARQPCWPALLPFSSTPQRVATHLLPFRSAVVQACSQQRQSTRLGSATLR